VKDF
jgi:hypothetical protein